ncbi:MAG TPA: hypothetical protein VMV82_06175 [Candidatus Dormibacteraeota bacterium]|nr:hypothetical protein [Candidatus Dormibacteraeota bacterium]
MSIVYVAFGAIVLIVVAVFAIVNIQQQRAIAMANATPTPGPNASAAPVQLVDNVGLGTPAFANPIKANPHAGAPVDGITCLTTEQTVLHIHTHLALFVNGKQLQIPAGIGIAPIPPQGCLYWVHTHDASGIIHIEAPQIGAPSGGPFTLGMFFDVWGEPLTSDDVAGKRGPVTAYVNGALWQGDLRAIPLRAHQQITLEVGKAVPPPNYAFPPSV